MPNRPIIATHSTSEFAILESLVAEPYRQGDLYALPVRTIALLRQYLRAGEAIVLLFDPENPEWAEKKVLGADETWKAETTVSVKDSLLCKSLHPDEIPFLEDASRLDDRVLFGAAMFPVRNVLLAPLSVEEQLLGAILFVNAAFNKSDERSSGFVRLVVQGLANAIHARQQNRHLTIRKADLEATYWQILHSRNTLRTFFDNIPSSVYIVDGSFSIIAINTSRGDRVNKTPRELVGEKCYQALRGMNTPCVDCRVMDALNGVPMVRNLRELGPHDSFIHWEITTTPIREDANEIGQVIVFEEDITEKWILEANLIQAEKLASIGQLAANVAHEINNPLAAIIANAQLLMRDLENADENTIDALQLIETAGDRAAKIVSNLLESARREKRHEFEEISLNETILDAISLLRYEINQRGVSINLDLAKGMPSMIANKNQLKGVWINLVNNALGAIESKEGRISISTRYENNTFTIVFADNGKGILPEHRDHVFEPFFTTKEAGKGTGLGLSVSLQAIKEHHGDIHFESVPGEGTEFVVILPDMDGSSY